MRNNFKLILGNYILNTVIIGITIIRMQRVIKKHTGRCAKHAIYRKSKLVGQCGSIKPRTPLTFPVDEAKCPLG